MKRIFDTYFPLVLLPLLFFLSCTGIEQKEDDSDRIAFYVHRDFFEKTKGVIEDTEDLVAKKLPLYVTDEGSGTFSAKEIANPENGVWRSDENWEAGKPYIFFGYIKSDGTGGTDEQRGSVSVSDRGYPVTVDQPDSYQEDNGRYADYLLSYKYDTDGDKRPLVPLQMERVTAGVQLYMTRGAGLGKVAVSNIEFRNVYTTATYSMTQHANYRNPVPENNFGMRNIWSVSIDWNSAKNYTAGFAFDSSYPDNAEKELAEYSAGKGRFHEDNLVMDFLTVHQELTIVHDLYIEYYVKDGVGTDATGGWTRYEHTFNLDESTPDIWARGHKVRYYINIDSNIELTGVIQEWKSVDFIEVTILPDK